MTRKKKKKWDGETIGNEDNVHDDAKSTTHSVCCHLHIPKAQIAAVSVEKTWKILKKYYLYKYFNVTLTLKIIFLKTNDQICMTACDNSIIFL